MTAAQYDSLLKYFVNNTLQEFFIAEINSQMEIGSKGLLDKKTRTFSNSNKLRVNSGALDDSFRSAEFKRVKSNNFNSITKFDITDGKVTGIFGSNAPYASVHENGMFIKSKGRMHKFMFAMFLNTKNVFWKILALSVKKKGGVNIKARPYFAPAIENINKNINTKLESFIDIIFKQI